MDDKKETYKQRILDLITSNHGKLTHTLQQVRQEEVRNPPWMELGFKHVNGNMMSLGYFTPDVYDALMELANERKIYFRLPEKMTNVEFNVIMSTTDWQKEAILPNDVVPYAGQRLNSVFRAGKTPLILSVTEVGDVKKTHRNLAFYLADVSKVEDNWRYRIQWVVPKKSQGNPLMKTNKNLI